MAEIDINITAIVDFGKAIAEGKSIDDIIRSIKDTPYTEDQLREAAEKYLQNHPATINVPGMQKYLNSQK